MKRSETGAVRIGWCESYRQMSRRDIPIVAWHEVPGDNAPQTSRPVGYGMIGAGVRMDLAAVKMFSDNHNVLN